MLLSRFFWDGQVQNKRGDSFYRQGFPVIVWWFKTVAGIIVVPRGTKECWVNQLHFLKSTLVSDLKENIYS